jgi:hypothetical protein
MRTITCAYMRAHMPIREYVSQCTMPMLVWRTGEPGNRNRGTENSTLYNPQPTYCLHSTLYCIQHTSYSLSLLSMTIAYSLQHTAYSIHPTATTAYYHCLCHTTYSLLSMQSTPHTLPTAYSLCLNIPPTPYAAYS